MKRIHLFEFEDQSWFPNWIRNVMTRMITVVHKLLGTPAQLAELIDETLERTGRRHVVDLCSGDGGPMPEVCARLRQHHGRHDVRITLTDLYPNPEAAKRINEAAMDGLEYLVVPADATSFASNEPHLRTMVCSFHHFRPEQALQLLRSAESCGEPFLIYEMSDNSVPPKYWWWIGLPFNFLFALYVGARARPWSGRQLLMTYVLPVIPLCFAWDGAVSNARTYTPADLSELVEQLPSTNYHWEIKVLEGRPTSRLCLIGIPLSASSSRAESSTLQ